MSPSWRGSMSSWASEKLPRTAPSAMAMPRPACLSDHSRSIIASVMVVAEANAL
jgi:predicted transporter